MDVLRELMRKPRPADSLAVGLFIVACLYAILCRAAHTIIPGIAFVLMVLGALPKQIALAFLVGASVIVLLQTNRSQEGFADMDPDSKKIEEGEEAEGVEGAEEKEETDEVEDDEPAEAQTEGFGPKKPMLPDNTDRKEPLVLGAAYKLPSERDDKDYHLDAGTTFLNAYKALKPDQIAAMTRDTQELLATQKSLVGMLDSFGPLLKDMNKITGFFGN
jgi:hypothetical protein